MSERRDMDLWLGFDIHQRREHLLAQAEHARIIRMLESGRSSSLRGHLADSAESLSDLLAGFARALRNNEA